MAVEVVWMTGKHEKMDKKSQEKASLKLRTFFKRNSQFAFSKKYMGQLKLLKEKY